MDATGHASASAPARAIGERAGTTSGCGWVARWRYDSAFALLATQTFDGYPDPRSPRAWPKSQPFHVMEVQTAARALEAAGRSVIHMEIGEPDFPTPQPVIDAAQRAIAAGDIYYTSALGFPRCARRSPAITPITTASTSRRSASSSRQDRRRRCCW